jgi:hypothetical protein
MVVHGDGWIRVGSDENQPKAGKRRMTRIRRIGTDKRGEEEQGVRRLKNRRIGRVFLTG